jgi:hypothetical protein
MATFLSPILQNAFSEPQVVNSSISTGAVLQLAGTSFDLPVLGAGDVVALCEVSVDSVPLSLRLAFDDGGIGDIDLGLSKIDNGNEVTSLTLLPVDQDCFASKFSLKGGLGETEMLFKAKATNIDKSDSSMWEWAGLSEKPDYENMMITFKCSSGSSAPATVSVKLRYVE